MSRGMLDNLVITAVALLSCRGVGFRGCFSSGRRYQTINVDEFAAKPSPDELQKYFDAWIYHPEFNQVHDLTPCGLWHDAGPGGGRNRKIEPERRSARSRLR